MEYQAVQRPGNLVQTIERLSLILDFLAKNPQGAGIKEIAAAIALPKGTVHRLLTSLAYFGYVRQDRKTRNYLLGFKLVEMGNLLLGQLDIRRQAEPFLRDLAERITQTVHLVMLDRKEIIYIDKVETDKQKGGLRMASRIGSRNPVHSCAVGKAIMAYLAPEVATDLLKHHRFVKRTEHTIADLNTFREHLLTVRQQGYAVDEEENEIGIRCVAAPIFNESGAVVAAVSVSGPVFQITPELVESLLKKEVVATAADISRNLGWHDVI